jgi:LysR family glycine cleavage system transcriptional activator
MRLPPLNSLKAFEATVRLGGFTSAAAELGVSPAAVSMQVKKAEEFLGKTLFRRTHNSLLLTDAGRSYYPAIAEALMGISAVTDQMLETEVRSRLVISTIQSLAEKWVAPAVSRFRQQHPDAGIELRIEADPVDLLRTRTDLRITYESHLYPQHTSVALFQDTAFPFCTRDFHARHIADKGIAAVPDALLIHTDWGDHYASHPTWAGWFRATGKAKTPDMRKGLRAGGAAVAFALAAQGTGIALIPRMLIDATPAETHHHFDDLPGLPLPYAYYAITPRRAGGEHTSSQKERLVRDLLQQLTPDTA